MTTNRQLPSESQVAEVFKSLGLETEEQRTKFHELERLGTRAPLCAEIPPTRLSHRTVLGVETSETNADLE
jgi:hypothetical protein